MTKKSIDKETAMTEIKTILSKFLPEKGMKIIFNVPGGSDSPDNLRGKIKIELTEYL